jgi:hypothetical protein
LKTYHLRIGNTYTKKIKEWDPNDLKLKKVNMTKNDSHRRYDIFFSENNEYIYFRVKDIQTEPYEGLIYNFEC